MATPLLGACWKKDETSGSSGSNVIVSTRLAQVSGFWARV
jgi:hypothetical protein